MRRALATLTAGGFLLGALPARALEGRVLMPDGTPVADAVVSIIGLTGSARTGARGEFRFLPDPLPPFQVLVILPGGVYAAPELIERLPQDGTPLEIRLSPAFNVAITVEAGATPFTEAPPASAPTILATRDLELRLPQTLTDAIDAIPGVGRIDEGHTAVPSIRGLARGRTLVLLDGARVTAERRAGPSATYLDPFFVEAIEVSRGLGAVGYGSDALGGVIHARTRQAAPGSPLRVRVQGTLGAGVPERTGGAQISKGLREGGAILQARYREAGDFDSPRGREPNSSFEDWGARGRVDQELGPGRAFLGVQLDRARDVGKPAADSNVTRTSYPIEDSERYLLGYDGDPAGPFSRWALHGFLGRYRVVTERDRLATAQAPRETRASDVEAWDYGVRLSGTSAVRGFRLETGLDLNGRRGLKALGVVESFGPGGTAARAEELSVLDAARRDLGLYASTDGRVVRRLTGSLGLRFDHIETRNRGGFFGGRETSQTAVSGYAALNAGPFAGVTLTGQAGRGFRDPSLSDRYFRGVGGRGLVTGNPGLEPEASLQYDLALRRAGRVRTALYLYRYRVSDLIERFRDGEDFFFRNRGSARIQGVELEAQAELGAGFSLELGAQASEGVSLDDDQPLADIAAPGLTLTLRRSLQGEKGHAYLRAVLRERDRDFGPTEKLTPGYGVLDLGLAWALGRRLDARLALKNLLDHAHPGSPDEAAALAPGRSALLTLSAKF